MKTYQPIPYQHPEISEQQVFKRSLELLDLMQQRRTIRHFSDQPVPKSVIENLILTASSAPSGANKQPWTFCAVSNPALKKRIREAAENEEQLNYTGRMPDSWLRDLAPLGTDWQKPFLETAPWLIIVFKRLYEKVEGEKFKNYYVSESVGLASGFLLSAIHQCGLVSLTHTPSPMNFLQDLLQRPENERPFLLIPVGYPAENAEVPDIGRKPLEEVMVYYE